MNLLFIDQSLRLLNDISHFNIPAEQFPDTLVSEDIETIRGKIDRRTAFTPDNGQSVDRKIGKN